MSDLAFAAMAETFFVPSGFCIGDVIYPVRPLRKGKASEPVPITTRGTVSDIDGAEVEVRLSAHEAYWWPARMWRRT